MIRTSAFLLVGLLGTSSLSSAVTPGQIDDFENGTVQGWEEGFVSPNPPTNVPSGGPAGAGDHYLRNVSNGVHGPGGKMIQFNSGQWSGDYVAAAISSIQMTLANFGPDTLYLRIAFEGSGTRYGSRTAVKLPPDSQWRSVTFGLGAGDLDLITGSASLNAVLATVSTMRILSVGGAPAWEGDDTASTLGADNILANAQSGVGEPAGSGSPGFVAAPNPFAARTVLRYELRVDAPVSIDIYDVGGRPIRSILSRVWQRAGIHEPTWDGRNSAGTLVPPGVYLARLSSPPTMSGPMLLEVRKIVVAPR